MGYSPMGCSPHRESQESRRSLFGSAALLLSYGDVNEAEIKVGQLREGGSAQVDLAALVDQPFRGAAIRDFDDHATGSRV